MKTLDHELKQKNTNLRRSGKGFVLRYPLHLADSLGLKGGEPFECFVNHKGEMLVRPMVQEVKAGVHQ